MPYGQAASRLLRVVMRRTQVTSESLAAYLRDEWGVAVDSSMVRKWATDERYHLPADVLPALAEHSGRPDLVFGPLLPIGCRLACEAPEPAEATGEEDRDAQVALAQTLAALVAGEASDQLLEDATTKLQALLDARASATPDTDTPIPMRGLHAP